MAGDSEPPSDAPGDGLELPLGEVQSGEASRSRKPPAIPSPAKTKTSGMVRRQVSVGGLKRGAPEPFEAREQGEVERESDGVGNRQAGPAGPLRRDGEKEPGASPGPEGSAVRGNASASGAGAGGTLLARRRRRGAEPEGEEAWTGSRTSLWFVLAGLACIGVIGYFLAANFKQANAVPIGGAPKRMVLRDSIQGIPIAEFVERSAELLPVVGEILQRAEESSGTELADLLRGGAESAARRAEWRKRGAVPARYLPVSGRELHAAAIGNTGYLVLAGLDTDHLLASAYFVKVGTEFKFDWEASEGYSELLPREVEGLADDEPRLMRVVISMSDFYTTQFPEAEYRCYSFHHQDPGEFVWGFAKRDSVVDRSLMVCYRAPDLHGTEDRATVKVRRGPAGARANQLEVVEFLHTDWLTP